MTTTSERCNGGNGHGDVPSGYTRFHSGLMAWRVCDECNGVGTVEVDAEPVEIPASANTIIVDGSTVTAPGFTVASFQRALQRADIGNDLPADLRRQRHAEPCGVRSRSPGWRSSA